MSGVGERPIPSLHGGENDPLLVTLRKMTNHSTSPAMRDIAVGELHGSEAQTDSESDAPVQQGEHQLAAKSGSQFRCPCRR
jgi:hypothetical protein